jgi:hypothetical protein
LAIPTSNNFPVKFKVLRPIPPDKPETLKVLVAMIAAIAVDVAVADSITIPLPPTVRVLAFILDPFSILTTPVPEGGSLPTFKLGLRTTNPSGRLMPAFNPKFMFPEAFSVNL